MHNDCPFCHHENARLYRKDNAGLKRKGNLRNIYSCKECGLLYPRPRYDSDDCGGYLSSFYTNKTDQQFINPRTRISALDPVVRIISKHINKISGKALDIGTYDGRYCYILEQLGFEAYGLEPQNNAVTFAKNNGLQVYSGMFPDNMPVEIKSQKYQIISILETIYYFNDLRKCLQIIKDMLEDGGYLLIKCHQGFSRFYFKNYSYFTRYNDYLQGIPTLKAMSYMLVKSGFRITKIMGETSADLLPSPLNRIGGSKLKSYIESFYRIAFQDITGFDIKKADRLIVLAKKGTF